MILACPFCGAKTEIEHVDGSFNVECVCGKNFPLGKECIVEEYSEVDSRLPERIGPYKVTEFIGYGGMGKIYRAIHPTLKIPVAIKAMRQEFSHDERACSRFMRSAKICARMNHPNIVRVYDCGYAEGNLFLVMEYIGGGSAQDLIDKYGPVEQTKAAEIAAGVCSGLAVAERSRIVHRDIKPENIMFAADGTVKLLDLGLAKIYGDKRIDRTSKMSETISNTSLGTAHYMSPEQSIDAKSCDGRSDIYSLGVSLYQMVTGKYPFDSSDPNELRRMHALEPVTPPSQLNSQLRPDMDYIILRCMEKKRSDRYCCADELAMDLDAFLSNRMLPSRFRTAPVRQEENNDFSWERKCNEIFYRQWPSWEKTAENFPFLSPVRLIFFFLIMTGAACAAAFFLK